MVGRDRLTVPDSPELAAQKLLNILPDGCELRTSTQPVGTGWEATAQIINPNDTPIPVYAGEGRSEEAALLKAIGACAAYWESRSRGRGSNC